MALLLNSLPPELARRSHPQARVRVHFVEVLECGGQLREHRMRVPEVHAALVVAPEGVDEAFRDAVIPLIARRARIRKWTATHRKRRSRCYRLGGIEPHAGLLMQPPEDQLLYKVMTAENLLRSISGAYLHFSRVDSYSDPRSPIHTMAGNCPPTVPATPAPRF